MLWTQLQWVVGAGVKKGGDLVSQPTRQGVHTGERCYVLHSIKESIEGDKAGKAQVLAHRKDPMHGCYLFVIIRGQNKIEGMVLSPGPAISYL